MPTPVIGSIASHLTFMLNTPINFTVNITGVTDANLEVEVESAWEGLYYDLKAGGVLHLEGTPDILLSDISFTITAKDTSDNATATVTRTYSVVGAAPIIQRPVGRLKFVKGLMHNLFIPIANLPAVFNVKGLLIGLRKTLEEMGGRITGRIPSDADFSVSSGLMDLETSNANGDDTENNVPFDILATEPRLGAATVEAHVNFAEITVPDLSGALAYEYTLAAGADAVWTAFDPNQPLIQPDGIEVTHGNLEVTLAFPPVTNATAYDYQLVTEAGDEGPWTRFTGTRTNNMVTIIIPNLIDGTSYTARLRVGSPWIGTQYVSVTFTAGRQAFVLNDPNQGDTTLYILNTGVPNGGQAIEVKRILLPTEITIPDGLAVNGDFAYIFNSSSGNYGLFVINWKTTANNARATTVRKNPVSGSPSVRGGIAYDTATDRIFAYITNFNPSGLLQFAANLSDGTALTDLGPDPTFPSVGNNNTPFADEGVSIEGNNLYTLVKNATEDIWILDKNRATNYTTNTRIIPASNGFYDNKDGQGSSISQNSIEGLEVIGDDYYVLLSAQRISRHRVNPSNNRLEEQWRMLLPAGLTSRKFLSIPR